MRTEFKPVIWSGDAGQLISWFHSSQLTKTWMSNSNERHYKPSSHVSVNLLAGVWPLLGQRRRRAYTPLSNTASHNDRAGKKK